MNIAERVAKTTIERFIDSAQMVFRSEQHDSVCDFDLLIEGSRCASVEVTTSTDEGLRGMIAAIEDPSKGGHFIPTTRCGNGWIVHPEPGANINRLRSSLDDYLANIEADGLQRFFSPIDAANYDSILRIFRDLRIEAGSVMKWKTGLQICVGMPGGGGRVTYTEVEDVVLHEARKEDNLRKLSNSGKSQRHLFVYLDPATYLPWVSLVDCSPPPDSVCFPKEITDVWVATCTRDENNFVAWRVQNGWCWQSLGVFAISYTV